MSFLNQLRVSVEGVNLYEGPVTALEEMDAEEAMVEYETGVDSAQSNLEQVERADAVVDELENTNEAIQGAVARDAFTPEVAAMAEAQRRTAAAALNLDPEEGAGAELVDQAGLESMVNNPGTISLEENKSMIKKIKDFIKDIVEKIKAGWRKFTELLNRIFRVLPSQIKQLKEFFKNDKNKEAANEYLSSKDDEKGVVNIFSSLPYFKGDVDSFGLKKQLADFIKSSNAVMKKVSNAKDREAYLGIMAGYPSVAINGYYMNAEVSVKDGRIDFNRKDDSNLSANRQTLADLEKMGLSVKGNGANKYALDFQTFENLLNSADKQIKVISNDNSFGKDILGALNNLALKAVDTEQETGDISWMRIRMINNMKHSSIMDAIRKDGIKAIKSLVTVGYKLRTGAQSKLKDESGSKK